MPLRVGIDLISKQRVAAVVAAHPVRISRLLRDEERGRDLDDAALFAAKEAVVKAAGKLSIFDATSFAITRVRGGYAAIPRRHKFESRLVEVGCSWVSVSFGEARGAAWALAVAMPLQVPNYQAVVAVRTVGEAMLRPERLDVETRAALAVKPRPEISGAARQAAIDAAGRLFGLSLPVVAIADLPEGGIRFTRPRLLESVAVSIAHDGELVIGAVARDAAKREITLDLGAGNNPGGVS
ncbi:MAG: 4'-phosphopantetheinyl transferase superfamily protein [Deltaproteobacteria bacterium]|nr:4'-phosphopantetheinyl transferase superfamily protein [Deltaproteobacteria bacterium]